MLRRQARLKREYIYRKSIEAKDAKLAQKKAILKDCIENHKQIPADIREEAMKLQELIAFDGAGGTGQINAEDDEYHWAGSVDPKIVVTTSRSPSTKLKQFAKEMKLMLPNSRRINRGHYENKHLMEACRTNNVTDIVIVHETRGKPDGMIISHLPFGPTAFFTIHNCVLRHDIQDAGTVSEKYPHLIFQNFTTSLGERVSKVLKFLYPVPKEDSNRVMAFINENDFISFRHYVHKTPEKDVELTEVGPRFELQLYKIIQGTIENEDTSRVEWVFKPYMNTSHKRKYLSKE